jgi:hypothetical protein
MASLIDRIMRIKFVGDTKDLDKATSKTSKGLSKLGKVATGLAVGGLIGLSYAALEGVKAFRAEQNIVRAFNRTVKNLGLPVGAATKAMDRMADRAVSLGFDDAETINGMRSFLQLTGDIGRATELTALAWDIARSRQIPLTAAIKAAQQIYKGSARELKNYGIEGKTGMEAVAAARRKERRQAAEWARAHPMQVQLGAISDAWADLVGSFSEGDFRGVQEAFGKIGSAIDQALFGRITKDGRRMKGGLIARLGNWGRDISNGIVTAIGEVDWGKTLQDTLNTALGALAEAAKNGALGNIAVLGAALAGAIFAFRFFVVAAKTMFGLPVWGAKAIVSVAAKAVGLAFSLAMFAVGKFLVAAKVMFGLAAWGAKAIVRLAALAVGKAFAAAMFVSSLFTSKASAAMTAVGSSPVVRGKARGAGMRLGRLTGAGMALGLVSAIAAGVGLGIIVNAVLDELGVGEGGWPKGFATNPDGSIKRLKKRGKKWAPFANGTAGAPGGWSLLGERGPELVNLRPGSRVLNSRATAGALGGGGASVTINVNAPVAADGARVGRDIAAYLDQFLARGGRLRHAPAVR